MGCLLVEISKPGVDENSTIYERSDKYNFCISVNYKNVIMHVGLIIYCIILEIIIYLVIDQVVTKLLPLMRQLPD